MFIFAYFSSHFHIYLNKFLFTSGFFFLFLGPWLEEEKSPKTLTYLRIYFRAKKKPILEAQSTVAGSRSQHIYYRYRPLSLAPICTLRRWQTVAAFSRPSLRHSASARGHTPHSVTPYSCTYIYFPRLLEKGISREKKFLLVGCCIFLCFLVFPLCFLY